MKFIEPQPAHLMYAFGGGWQVMRYVWDNIFKKTASAADWWYKQGDTYKSQAEVASETIFKYWLYMAYGGFQLAGVCQYVAAFVIVAFYCALQFILLVLWAGISGVLIAALAGFNFLYGNLFKIFFRCPDCHEQMNIPVYVCPSCATEHTRLWPSAYGVFNHRCSKCNTRLPTLDVLGRTGLVQKCAACNRPMNREIGRLINIHIPVIGGPLTGKSNYIFTATNQFIEKYALPRGFEISFPDEDHKRAYESNLASLQTGKELVKTANVVPQAYNLAVKKPRDLIGRIVYIYDAAGEAYATEDNTLLQTYYKYVHGLIFIIDPFAIEFYHRQHESEIASIQKMIRPSTLSVMDAYSRMLSMLESCIGVRKGGKFDIPIAVVISKTDVLDLEKQVGHTAVSQRLQRDSSMRSEAVASRRVIEEFLEGNELGNLVRDLEFQFKNVGYFACSALGRMPDSADTRPYEPIGVLEPLLWLLGEAGVVGVRQELVRTIDDKDSRLAKATGNFFKSFKFYYWDSLKPEG